MFSNRVPQRMLLIVLLLAAQLGGCAPGLFGPVPFAIEVDGAGYEVRRYPFLSRGGFVEIAPVTLRPTGTAGFDPGPEGRALARAVLGRYCAWFGFETGPPDTSYWTMDGSWQFVQGCIRDV